MSAETSGTLRIEKLPEREYLERAGVAVSGAAHEPDDLDYTEAEVETMRRTGPFSVVPNTKEVRMKYTVGFRTKTAATVKIEFKDLVEGFRATKQAENAVVNKLKHKFNRYNSKGCLPISLRILGATVGSDSDLTGHYTFKIKDAKGNAIQSGNAYKHGREDLQELGYPLQLLRNETGSALEEPPNLLDDHKQYWHIDIKDLTAGVEPARDPDTKQEFMLVPKNSVSAVLCHYALSVKNNHVDDLLNNKNFTYQENERVLKIPAQTFNDVKTAYERKLKEVDKTSFDISTVTCSLTPMPLSDALKDRDDIGTSIDRRCSRALM